MHKAGAYATLTHDVDLAQVGERNRAHSLFVYLPTTSPPAEQSERGQLWARDP